MILLNLQLWPQRMASKGAKVFQTWFDGRDKLDKLMLAGEIHITQNKKIKLLKIC